MNQQEREQIERIKHHAQRRIWVTFQKEGIHCYPAAATDPALKTGDEYDVSFLGAPHRHIFHFRVWIDVVHNDRDIEFIQFKRWLQKLYQDGTAINWLQQVTDFYVRSGGIQNPVPASKYFDMSVYMDVVKG